MKIKYKIIKITLPLWLRAPCGWGDRKNIRARGKSNVEQKVVFWTQHSPCFNELTAAAVICRRLSFDWVHQHFILEWGGTHEAPSIPKGLLAVNGCWRVVSDYLVLYVTFATEYNPPRMFKPETLIKSVDYTK